MPGFNGTGPAGMGPMTGGGRGYCNPSGTAYGTGPAWGSGYSAPRYGRGFGRGRGFRGGYGPGFGWGRGYRRGFGWQGAYPPAGVWDGPGFNAPYSAPNPEDEVNMLKGEADAVKNELDAIQKRIEELESQSSES